MGKYRGELLSLELAEGVALHVNRRQDLKTVRIDLFLGEQLYPGRHTRLALLARMLERGTRQLPDMRSLNRFVDELYGADFGVEAEQFGERQALHVAIEILDPRVLPRHEDLVNRAASFVHEVVCEPLLHNGVFPSGILSQEKTALQNLMDGQLNDKQGYAQRRCIELMCAGEPCSLSPLGDPQDLATIDAADLHRFYRDLLCRGTIDVYVSGLVEAAALERRWRRFLDWPRQLAVEPAPAPRSGGGREAERRVFETLDVSQARIVLGYRTGVRPIDAEYPALLLLNQLWGEDSHSRLFRVIREQAGLCYHIASHLEDSCGLLFVSAGIEATDYREVTNKVAAELESLRAGRISASEVQEARSLLASRLLQLDEDPAGLIQFHYRQRLGRSGYTPLSLSAAIEGVDEAAVSGVARELRLDMSYFAHPSAAGQRSGV